MGMVAKRFEVWLVNLDATTGREIKKTRPCVIVSPDVINKFLDTVITAPLTSTIRSYPTRVSCTFQKKERGSSIRSNKKRGQNKAD